VFEHVLVAAEVHMIHGRRRNINQGRLLTYRPLRSLGILFGSSVSLASRPSLSGQRQHDLVIVLCSRHARSQAGQVH
jgi:hypothetical protein